jgi:hypothetical protein
MIEVSVEEAKEIALEALRLAGPPAAVTISGITIIIKALQLLGYRVSRPLKEV